MNDTKQMVIIFLDYLLAEAATVILLIVWRHRVGSLSLVFGWLWAAIGAVFLCLVCLEFLGFRFFV